jgi:hypothetical protein
LIAVQDSAMPKIDPEIAAIGRAMQFEEEGEDIAAFLVAYPRATGEVLELIEGSEAPDAICRRPDGALVGVEHTRVRRSPDDAHWEAILDRRDEMDIEDTLEEIERLIFQKAERRKKFSTARTILLVAIYESDFDIATRLAAGIPLEDLEDTGFEEIWLADFQGIREGAHREVRLFGLYPEDYREITGRSWFDQKPYG